MIQASIQYSVFAIRLFGIRYLVFAFVGIRSIRYTSFFTIRRPLERTRKKETKKEKEKQGPARPMMRPLATFSFLSLSFY